MPYLYAQKIKKTDFILILFITIWVGHGIFAYEKINPDNSFSKTWLEMQQIYQSWQKSFEMHKYQKYYSGLWKNNIHSISQLITGHENKNWFDHCILGGAMIRKEYGPQQQLEECYFSYCISEKTKNILKNFDDHELLPKISDRFPYCINTLGHLFYVARILEKMDLSHETAIIEFGGGFGSVIRILKKIVPSATIISIDFPELLSLQYLFLKSTLQNTSIVAHTNNNIKIEKEKINLIPVFLLDNIELNGDVFISTFALSEAPEYVQKLIINKNFFNTHLCYLTGQINGF